MAAPRLTRRRPSRNARRTQELRTETARDVEHHGKARLGKRTKLLVKRLKPSDIAVIAHEDIDRVAADDLVARGVRCVLNVCRSSSGRYPNTGPTVLVDAGVHVVDLPDVPLFELLEDGQQIVVRGGRVLRDGETLAEGEVLDREAVARAHEHARKRIGEALEAFAENTMEHIRAQRELLARRLAPPPPTTTLPAQPPPAPV